MTKKKEPRQEPLSLNEPWIGKRTGVIVIVLLSIGLAAYTTWQLAPTQGLGNALLWGVGSAVAIWAVFLVSYAINTFLRR